MTPEPKLSFSQTCFFPLKATLKVFLSYFVFPLKNKIKTSGDSKSFSKNQFFTKQIKKSESRRRVGTHMKMRGPQNGDFAGDYF